MICKCNWGVDQTLQLGIMIANIVTAIGAIVAIVLASKANKIANQANQFTLTEI